MPNRLPTLTILSPLPYSVVGTASFSVTGFVTAPGMPEPVTIDAISVQVDSQPAVQATIKHIPVSGNQSIEVTFSAAVQITGGQDPHTVTVTVKSDAGIPVTGTVTVTGAPRPVVWADIQIPPSESDPPSVVAAQLNNLLGEIAQRMVNLSIVKDLFAMNKLVVGPNIVTVANPPILRIGFWLLDLDFPTGELVQPTTDFPLAQLTPDAAAGSFALVPLLLPLRFGYVSPATYLLFAFGLAIPTATVQVIVNALFPSIKAEAERHGGDVNSITVQIGAANSLVGVVSGSFESVTLSAAVTVTLGVQQRQGIESQMPAVLTSISNPLLGFLAAKVQSAINGVLEQLPAWIPLRNSVLGGLQEKFPFPMVVLNFDSFGTNDSGVIGKGTGSLANRDQSMVAVNLIGPDSFPNYSLGNEGNYDVLLTAFEPDNGQMTWKLSGVDKTNILNTDQFTQAGEFSTTFPVPVKASGSEKFTLSVSGTETCATDSTKTLNRSASLPVTVTVLKGQPEMTPAADALAVADL